MRTLGRFTPWLVVLLLATPLFGQSFRRGGLLLPSAPVSPGALPADMQGSNWTQGPLPSAPAGPWVQPPPGTINWPNQPGWNQPGQGQPGWNQPGWNQPGWNQPGWNQPELGQLNPAQAAAGLIPPGPGQLPMRTPPGTRPVFNIYSPTTREHVFENQWLEVLKGVQQGAFEYRGVGFFVSTTEFPGAILLSRGQRQSTMRFLTTNVEFDQRGRIEGGLGYINSRQAPGWVPLYEWYNPHRDLHFYTLDPQGDRAGQFGYRPMGVIGYVIPPQ